VQYAAYATFMPTVPSRMHAIFTNEALRTKSRLYNHYIWCKSMSSWSTEQIWTFPWRL